MLNEGRGQGRGEATRRQLVSATLQAIREVGFAGLSARVVADIGGINQALIFYHFGSMDGLVTETCRQATAQRVASWQPELERVADLRELVALARRLHTEEAEQGNVTVLAQALAAARSDSGLAAVIGETLALWLDPLEATAQRVMRGTVLEELVAPADVARTVAAAFVGIELFDGVVQRGDHDPFAVLERLSVLGQLVLEAGPVTRTAVRRHLRGQGQMPRQR